MPRFISFFIISPAFMPSLWDRSPTLMASDIFITLLAAFGTVISVFLSSLSGDGGLILSNFSSLSNLPLLPKGPFLSYCFFLAGLCAATIFISFLTCFSSGIFSIGIIGAVWVSLDSAEGISVLAGGAAFSSFSIITAVDAFSFSSIRRAGFLPVFSPLTAFLPPIDLIGVFFTCSDI